MERGRSFIENPCHLYISTLSNVVTFYCLEELSEYLKMETVLCSAVLFVAVVECHHHSNQFTVTVIHCGDAILEFDVVGVW